MPGFSLEIIIIAILLLANGVFAMAEIAVVSARKARLKKLAEDGDKNAALALSLASSPGKFLSTVQVGITLVGTLAAAMGGSSIADSLKHTLETVPFLVPVAHYLALGIVVTVLTYFSVIIGELVPKRLALNDPERLASALARPMNSLANIASPLVNLLSRSSDILMALLGVKKSTEPPVSEEEVRVLIDEGLSAGVFRKAERDWVESVFKLDERTAGDLMTPRPQIVWLSLDDPDEENWRIIARSGHSNFPVYQKSHENVVGMISVKSLWANLSLAGHVEIASLVTPPLYVPETMPASKLIEEFRRTSEHIALTVDEFGGLQGVVTLNDVLVAIVGNLPERKQGSAPCAVQRPDGTWLVDALLDIDQLKRVLAIPKDLPEEDEGAFSTLGGFIINLLGHIPIEGERVSWENYQFEILDMDNQRIDKVLVTISEPPKTEGGKEEQAEANA